MAVIETMNRRTLCNLLDLFESDGLAVTAFRREPSRDLPTEEPSRFAFLTCSITQSGHFFLAWQGELQKSSPTKRLFMSHVFCMTWASLNNSGAIHPSKFME